MVTVTRPLDSTKRPPLWVSVTAAPEGAGQRPIGSPAAGPPLSEVVAASDPARTETSSPASSPRSGAAPPLSAPALESPGDDAAASGLAGGCSACDPQPATPAMATKNHGPKRRFTPMTVVVTPGAPRGS